MPCHNPSHRHTHCYWLPSQLHNWQAPFQPYWHNILRCQPTPYSVNLPQLC
jgi:hypothetical protein